MRQRGKSVKEKPRPAPETLSYDPSRLKRRRFAAGLTQADAAAKAGCTPSNLCRLEHGEHDASPKMLAAIAEAYGCEITDLMPPESVAA
jgi:transcriptional regulator with XRE-family HTH domain